MYKCPGGEETRNGKPIGHASSESDRAAVFRKEMYHLGDVLQGASFEQLASFRVGLGGEVGVDERVEGDGKGCSVVVERLARVDWPVSRTTLISD